MTRSDVYGEFDESGRLMRLVTQSGETINNPADEPGRSPGVIFSNASGRPSTDYQFTGTAAGTVDNTISRTPGGSSIRVAVAAGNSDTQPIHATAPQLDAKGRVGAWVYVPDYTKLTALVIKVSLGDDTYTNGYFQTYSFADGEKAYNGWHFVGFAGAEFGGVLGAPNWATQPIYQVRIGATAPAGGGVFYLDSIVIGWRSIAQIMITCDDGYSSWFRHALPVLESYGLRASMSIIAGLIGSAPEWATMQQLKDAYSAGHDLCPHGAAALTTLPSDAARRADIAMNREFLINSGMPRGSDFYVYPNGVYQMAAGDNSIITALKDNGIKAARGTTSPRNAKIGPGLGDARYLLPIIGADAGTNPATIKARIDAAVSTGDLCVLMYHGVALAGASGISVNLNDIAEVAEYIAQQRAQGKLRVIIASQLTANI